MNKEIMKQIAINEQIDIYKSQIWYFENIYKMTNRFDFIKDIMINDNLESLYDEYVQWIKNEYLVTDEEMEDTENDDEIIKDYIDKLKGDLETYLMFNVKGYSDL